MKFTVIATVLLSTFVTAQAYKTSVLVNHADDIGQIGSARDVFCGIVNQCSVVTDVAKSSSLLELKKELENIAKDNIQIQNNLKTQSANTDAAKQRSRYADFKSIADKKPVFWLSGTYFDGLRDTVSLSRSGQAPQIDAVGNAVTIQGKVTVAPVSGKMAYIFDKTNSITSSVSVNNEFTFVAVYRFVDSANAGRFFTAPTGNKLFGGWGAYSHRVYNEGWISEAITQSTDTAILIFTVKNGVKNVWTHNNQLVVNSRAGNNDWGKVVLGRPQIFTNEAAQVNVYEALVFDKAFDDDQRFELLQKLKRWYDIV